MDKRKFFDENHFLVQDERYILREQMPEDKLEYYNLYEGTSILAKRMGSTAFKDFFEKQWEQRKEEEYQRQGIAYDTLQLFMRKGKSICKIDYFFVRIYSDNEPSKKLFRKLGAVEIGSEPSEYQVFLNHMKERMTEEEYEKIKRKNPDMERIAGQRWIGHYKIELK